MKFFNVLALLATSLLGAHPEFEIVIPSYNNEQWCIKNLQSVLEQTYPHWHAIVINDASTDRTGLLVDQFVVDNQCADKIEVIHNSTNHGALENIYRAVHACPDHKIIITLDGDDWFAHPGVLERVAQEYENPDVWLTYGQFVWYPSQYPGFAREIPDEIAQRNLFRYYDWVSTHLRSFYAWLFKKINPEDLKFQGQFFPVAWDLGFMWPMLEMASPDHFRFIPDILYVYNYNNPLNDGKQRFEFQTALGQWIRTKPIYQPLGEAPCC